jgi:hypothetical protein
MWEIGNLPISRHSPVGAEQDTQKKQKKMSVMGTN